MNPPNRSAGFTIVELLIGMSLALIVMTAVLSSYVFLARSFTRTIGLGLLNQPTLEAQGRRALATFAQDVQSTSVISNPVSTPTVSAPTYWEVTLTVPLSTGGTKNVTYVYNGPSPPNVPITSYNGNAIVPAIPVNSLARIDRNTNTTVTLHTNLLSGSLTCYDASGNPYTTYTNYLIGIKQLSMAFTAQAGSSANNTLTQVYKVASPRLLIRNDSPLY